MAKRKADKHKVATRIVAGVLAILMVLSVATTLIWVLVSQL